MKDRFMIGIQGLFVGSTMLVPGVSGGSMAMILGVYDRLIHAVSSFRKQKKASLLFLLIFSIGAIIGMVAFARPILAAINRWEKPMLYFFIGIVAGGIPLMVKKAQLKTFQFTYIIYFIIGIVVVVLLGMLPGMDVTSSQNDILHICLLLVEGFISAIALVLPGISVSYMLLLLGMYDTTMQAISRLYLPYLIPLGIGVILGIISTTKLLETLMNRYTQSTYLVILGFVAGSVFEILPGFPSIQELWICAFALLAGFCIIMMILKFDKEEC